MKLFSLSRPLLALWAAISCGTAPRASLRQPSPSPFPEDTYSPSAHPPHEGRWSGCDSERDAMIVSGVYAIRRRSHCGFLAAVEEVETSDTHSVRYEGGEALADFFSIPVLGEWSRSCCVPPWAEPSAATTPIATVPESVRQL
jgi:hypothetical protein